MSDSERLRLAFLTTRPWYITGPSVPQISSSVIIHISEYLATFRLILVNTKYQIFMVFIFAKLYSLKHL